MKEGDAITHSITLSQKEYDSLKTKCPNTVYHIVNPIPPVYLATTTSAGFMIRNWPGDNPFDNINEKL